jgi:hypothetical protein
MSSNTPGIASRPIVTAESYARFTELVRKNETSPANYRKRRTSARRKLGCVLKEHRRYAMATKLRAVALTLTFRGCLVFNPEYISSFLDRLRRALKRMGHALPYAWVLEKAGQFHYHLILWLPRVYKLDPVKLSKWWPCGSTWVESCKSVEAWGKYMVKFDSIAQIPKGARLHGHGGLDDAGKLAVARIALPYWLQVQLPVGHRARRCSGGRWVCTVTGEIFCSPYIWTPWGAVLVGPKHESS